MKIVFHVGDKIKQNYISDCNKHNGMIATILNLHEYNYYPNGDESVVVKKTQAQIVYDNGDRCIVGDIYLPGSGSVCLFEKVD